MNPRAKILLPLFLIALVGFSVQRLFLADAPSLLREFSGPTMGTTYSVKVPTDEFGVNAESDVASAIERELSRVDGLMSTYDSASELSRFNRSHATTPFAVSAETAEVFALARAVSAASSGAFDVTVGPLVEAWGFGPSPLREEHPTGQELDALAEHVGYDLIEVDIIHRTIQKTHSGTVADLSAIAKGFAVDRVAGALAALGFESFLVEIGGELKARGRKPDGTAWQIGIESPEGGVRKVYRTIALVDMAIATSGDYRNFYERDGILYAHIIDPRTRRPVRHAGTSISVLHERAALADAWATALSVLGPDEGLTVAEREGLTAFFIVRTQDGFESRATSTFRERHGPEPQSR